MYVHVQIAVPTKLSTEQREKLDEFAKSLGEQTSPRARSFFEKAKKFFRCSNPTSFYLWIVSHDLHGISGNLIGVSRVPRAFANGLKSDMSIEGSIALFMR